MSTTFTDYLGMLLWIGDYKSVVIPVFGVKQESCTTCIMLEEWSCETRRVDGGRGGNWRCEERDGILT